MDIQPSKRLLKVLAGQTLSPPPIWLMRQAGRYLPEYRETRKQAGGFLDLCFRSDLAEEVTLQPIRRYGFDAAILFADILLLPMALGRKLWFETGEGPRLNPLVTNAEVDALDTDHTAMTHLQPVFDTVARLHRSLPKETTLIGFAGAPWTVATYVVAGRGKDDQAGARALIARDRGLFKAIMDRLETATITYALRQIDSGAEVFKLFDSWAGALKDSPTDLEEWIVEPAKRIVAAVREKRPGVPVLYFPRGVGIRYPEIAESVDAEGVAIDQSISMAWAASNIAEKFALQGNLDPIYLSEKKDELEKATNKILDAAQGRSFVFNLGHGITPEADPDAVSKLIEIVRSR